MKAHPGRNWFVAGFVITAGAALLYLQFASMEVFAPWEPAAAWAKVVFFPAKAMGRLAYDHLFKGIASLRTTVYLSGAVGIFLMSVMVGFMMIWFRHLMRRK